MKWLINFLNSSIGQKFLMAITGLFLCSFLLIHLIGNLQLFVNDNGLKFNAYAKFMTTNPVIKFTSYGLYLSILLHAIKGFALAFSNKKAKGQRYAAKTNENSSFLSKGMAVWGSAIFIFIGVHMYNFWAKMHFDKNMPIDSENNKNLYKIVSEAFTHETFGIPLSIFYVLSMLMLSFHLIHGFQSAFQTFGLNHKKYTPTIKILGFVFSVIVPLGFAILPIYFLVK